MNVKIWKTDGAKIGRNRAWLPELKIIYAAVRFTPRLRFLFTWQFFLRRASGSLLRGSYFLHRRMPFSVTMRSIGISLGAFGSEKSVT